MAEMTSRRQRANATDVASAHGLRGGRRSVRLKIRLFAAAADAIGAREATEEFADVPTARMLLQTLARRGGPLLLRCSVAVDRHVVPADSRLPEGADVAVLPPVSGGAGLLHVGPEPITAEAVVAEAAQPDLGAVVLFLGTVRGLTDGVQTEHLQYEAYTDMAMLVLEGIAARAQACWPGCRIAMWHRIGLLKPGEPAVAVAAATTHRGDAFAAARYCIERLKVELPIWKKEVFPGGRAVWVDHP